MTQPIPQQATTDGLKALLRDVSVIQASQYFHGAAVSLTSEPEGLRLGQVLSRYLAMVLLSSNELRVIFKVHFNPEQIRAWRREAGAQEEDLGDRQILDFMKELANQMGGRVCRILDAHQISAGMSIPLCTRGIHEIYADYQSKTGAINKFGDFWRLDGPFQSIYCSCHVEVLTRQDLSGIKAEDQEAQEGELDFL
jgi:hypothetical protein